jgi:hypothetical protein
MNPIETAFRRIETLLDELLEHAGEQLRCAGLQIEDHSARTYHYKNDHLFWSHSFLKDWLVDIEKARVTVSLDYSEPVRPQDPPSIRLTWRAELFWQGQVSSIDKRGEALLTLNDLKRDGIAVVIADAVAKAAVCLPAAR